MKRYKRLYLLLGVLAVACIATFGVLRFEEHQDIQSAEGASRNHARCESGGSDGS